MNERVLVACAHPDDETLGCGGTIARHIREGDEVSIVAMTDGVGSRVDRIRSGGAREREMMFRKACRALGTVDVHLHQFADNQMDGVALIRSVMHIERHIDRFNPTVVYTHHSGDLNVDHRVTHNAVNVACRPRPGCPVKTVLYFEVPCSTSWGTGFNPNYFVDISDTMGEKVSAMQCYESEILEWPHPRSVSGIRTMAQMRGMAVGIDRAEAFVVGRIVR